MFTVPFPCHWNHCVSLLFYSLYNKAVLSGLPLLAKTIFVPDVQTCLVHFKDLSIDEREGPKLELFKHTNCKINIHFGLLSTVCNVFITPQSTSRGCFNESVYELFMFMVGPATPEVSRSSSLVKEEPFHFTAMETSQPHQHPRVIAASLYRYPGNTEERRWRSPKKTFIFI